MKKESKAAATHAEAVRLLREGGQPNPTHERIELARWLMQTCRENDWKFTGWDAPLMPTLDSFGDVELVCSVEETFDVRIDDVEIESARLETFGDLIQFLEPYVAPNLLSTLHRPEQERRKIARAACPTQAAFYVLRSTLSEIGAVHYGAHRLRPQTPLLSMPSWCAQSLAQNLSADFGLTLPLRRVLWNRFDAGAVQWAFFVLSVVVCILAVSASPAPFVIGGLLCLLLNGLFAGLVKRYRHYKWPAEYQTLGDLARKIAATAQNQTAQAAS